MMGVAMMCVLQKNDSIVGNLGLRDPVATHWQKHHRKDDKRRPHTKSETTIDTKRHSKIAMNTFGTYSRCCTCLFVIMLQFIWVRSFNPRLISSLGQTKAFRTTNRVHEIARMRLSMASEGKDRDSSKAKEAVAEYKDSGLAPLEDYKNPSNRDDQVFSAISEDGSVKITACTARNLVNDLMIMHTMTAVPADAIGRTAVCALMMSNGMQEEQTCQITLNADGPLRGVVAVSDGLGNVKGYVGSPMLGDVDLPEAVGKGMVQVVKNHPDWSNPYNGITSIRHGDIDRDIGAYLAESEQRSCALAAGTAVNGILCTAAGGYLIEQLPNATPETLAQVEKNLAKLVERDGGDKLPTNLLLQGVTPLEIAETVLDGLGMVPLQQISPKFQCQCSSDRLIRALRLIPRTEVDEILESEEKLEARCEFCGKVYSMGPDEIRERLDTATGDPSLDSDFEESEKKE